MYDNLFFPPTLTTFDQIFQTLALSVSLPLMLARERFTTGVATRGFPRKKLPNAESSSVN